MCFGHGRIFEDEPAKRVMFEEMTERYFPGRTAGRDYTPASSSHLTTTAVVEVAIEEITAKMRAGGPKGPQDAQDDAPGTCGVVDV